MCGIVSIISKNKNVKNDLIKCLKQLEYRGYDSAGIALLKDNKILSCKAVGKVKNLEDKLQGFEDSNIGIVHTRWATHGGVNENNAHPHTSCDGAISLVHNGIIENYKELKAKLAENGFTCKGDTDSEVLSNLIAYNYSKIKNIQTAFFKSLSEVEGSYGVAMICKDDNRIFIAKNGSPILLGIAEDMYLSASSAIAFSGITNKIIQLNDGEKATLSMDGYKIFDKDNKEIQKEVEEIKIDDINADKGNFDHFMLKEIFEQPEVLKRTIKEYIDGDKIVLPQFNFDVANIDFLTIVACGTSYYAGCVAKYFIEELTGIFVNVDIASEFRYRTNPLPTNGVAMFISQSGETADTIAALKLCKEQNQYIMSLVNVIHSNIANLSDVVLKTVAGVEVGVASTKAFTAQVSILYLLALEIARQKGKLSQQEFIEKLNNFKNSYKVLEEATKEQKNIQEIANELSKTNHILYIGRDIYYPLALEGALKIKEISYIPTQGIASGELKHGPIALIDKNTFVVALTNSKLLFDKNASSIEEISARNGKIILLSDKDGAAKLQDKVYKIIETPKANDKFQVLLSCIPAIQLLAYYTALNKGLDIDKPRNLAKSVTVE